MMPSHLRARAEPGEARYRIVAERTYPARRALRIGRRTTSLPAGRQANVRPGAGFSCAVATPGRGDAALAAGSGL